MTRWIPSALVLLALAASIGAIAVDPGDGDDDVHAIAGALDPEPGPTLGDATVVDRDAGEARPARIRAEIRVAMLASRPAAPPPLPPPRG